jgi:hypothetical protein
MRTLKAFLALLAAGFVASCGGGGSDAGSSPFGSGSGSGGGSGGDPTADYAVVVDVQRSGTSVNAISGSETAQAVAVVSSRIGGSVEGIVVTFSETGPGLLKFAPTVGTALTDSSGVARVDVSAKAAAQTGATAIQGSAKVAAATFTATKAIEVKSSGGAAAATPSAINFVGSVPSGTAIVVKGAGGSGRSESAVLTFKVVDAQNSPINGVSVTFSLNQNAGGAAIQPATALTNADGVATTTVTSGSQPASIVVAASTTGTAGATITSQSDTLIVSNSLPVAGGFEIVAAKYNLDGRKTGDKTTITAFVRDEFGNPVPDGVAVNFTTDFGVVAASTLGGCTTVNGQCDVDFLVQEPRGNGLATVKAQIRVGNSTTLIDEIQINMAASTSGYVATDLLGVPLTQLDMAGSCDKTFELLLQDGEARSVAAGATIATAFLDSGLTVTVPSGSPVLDTLGGGFPPSDFALKVVVGTAAPTSCVSGGAATGTAVMRLAYKTPGGIQFTQRVTVTYPK